MTDRGLSTYVELLKAAQGECEADSNQLERRTIPVRALACELSPRADGLDSAHVERLVEAEWPVAPIVVHEPSMQVIDGHHRLAAAIAKGLDVIDTYLFHGSMESAFVLSVRANVTHGLPLSLSDRRAAARKILTLHGNWSDRAIGKSTGLSAKAVNRLRSAIESGGQLDARVGRDGRWRRLDTSGARLRAAELLTQSPQASLREVARAVGLSPGTVRDVRLRLERGDSPLPDSELARHADHRSARPVADTATTRISDGYVSLMDTEGLLNALSRNPALRMNESGRKLLRWLHTHAIDGEDPDRVLDSSPDHCVEHLLALSRRCAERWSDIANSLAERLDEINTSSPESYAS
jgi:ParB-like chromosome segregation protein Spo0J